MKKGSVIVRTLNEARWIKLCIASLREQAGIELEIIVVDSGSTDGTTEIARAAADIFVEYEGDYFPGCALNIGFEKAANELVFILSAHCIPVSQDWALTMSDAMSKDKTIAGVYGRQHPMSFSADVDFRDLFYTFRAESRLQVNDFFFHNANSCVRKSVWERHPFRTDVPNIEDLIWGKQVIREGYKLHYDACAGVYHYHGLHHGNDARRMSSMVEVLKSLYQPPKDRSIFIPANLKLIVLIFSNGRSASIENSLFQFKQSLEARFLRVDFACVGAVDEPSSIDYQDFFIQAGGADSEGFWSLILKAADTIGADSYDGVLLINTKFGERAVKNAAITLKSYVERGMVGICPVHYITGTVMRVGQKSSSLDHFKDRPQYFKPVLGMGGVLNPRVSFTKEFEPEKFLLLQVAEND